MIQYVAQRMMEMDAESLCAAGYGERSPGRLNSHNGYRERLRETRADSVDSINKVFAQATQDAAILQWRSVTDQPQCEKGERSDTRRPFLSKE